jgi:UDP-N-acetylglucosamine 4,6-dehydratase/5-epimerase
MNDKVGLQDSISGTSADADASSTRSPGLDERSILITGGTGSFGQAFVKRVLAHYKPRRLVVYSRDELKQFEMAQLIKHPSLRFFIGDIRDEARLERALEGIDTIIHAAALKQIVAAEYNPIECIKTNVLGAENIINAAMNTGVRRVLALSTDKAVNPVNLYGATKLCSDRLFVAANNLSRRDRTRFSVVRYGNVLGSRGSVVPVFKQLLASGEPLPITDDRMTRFWITLDEAAAFVERCAHLMHGGEIFVPKIPSMRIKDLAEAMDPGGKRKMIGIRPGEKLHEVLMPNEDAEYTLSFDEFFVIRPQIHLWQDETPTEYGGKVGQPVGADFEYRSDKNVSWMTPGELRRIAGLRALSPTA